MSLSKYDNLKQLLHPGSYHDVKQWLKKNKSSMSDKALDELALKAIKDSMNAKSEPDTEKALKLFNIKLKQHIKEISDG